MNNARQRECGGVSRSLYWLEGCKILIDFTTVVMVFVIGCLDVSMAAIGHFQVYKGRLSIFPQQCYYWPSSMSEAS